MIATQNTRINALKPLATPDSLIQDIQASESINTLVQSTRSDIHAMLHGTDDRLLVVAGPCSIHDPSAALDYAQRLTSLREQYHETLCIVMRVYFEKPRTTVGWKGLINDPTLDNQFDITRGLKIARQLLLDINAMGLPAGTEFLDTIIPQYIADLISWSAIGARTTESQIHRELASGLSMPVGFKNSTSGNTDVALDAVFAATHAHHFLGVTSQGEASIVSTTGNEDCHIILRGGKVTGPNYQANTVTHVSNQLSARNLPSRVMIDCSHGNSQKDHTRQRAVLADVCEQIQSSSSILGVMLESNIEAGNQPLQSLKQLTYGQSVTDACMDWQTTVACIDQLATAASNRSIFNV